jgi:hypothetical protein
MKEALALSVAPKPIIATAPPERLLLAHLLDKPETVWRADVAGDQQELLRTNALIATICEIRLGSRRFAFFGRFFGRIAV